MNVLRKQLHKTVTRLSKINCSSTRLEYRQFLKSSYFNVTFNFFMQRKKIPCAFSAIRVLLLQQILYLVWNQHPWFMRSSLDNLKKKWQHNFEVYLCSFGVCRVQFSMLELSDCKLTCCQILVRSVVAFGHCMPLSV